MARLLEHSACVLSRCLSPSWFLLRPLCLAVLRRPHPSSGFDPSPIASTRGCTATPFDPRVCARTTPSYPQTLRSQAKESHITPEQRWAKERNNLRSENSSLRTEIHILRNQIIYSSRLTGEYILRLERMEAEIKRLKARGFWARVFNRPV